MQCGCPAEHTGALGSAMAQQEPAQPAEVPEAGAGEVCVTVQDFCAASGALPSAAQQGDAGAAVDDAIDMMLVEPPSQQQGCQDGQPQSEETQSDLPGLRLSAGNSGKTVTATGITVARPIDDEQESQQMQRSLPAEDTYLPEEATLKVASPDLEGAGAAASPQSSTDQEAAASMAIYGRPSAIDSAIDIALKQQPSSEALDETPLPDNTAPGRGACTFMFPAGQCSQTGSLADGGHAAAASHQNAEGNASAALQAGSQRAGDCRASPSKGGLDPQQPHPGASLGRNNSDGLAVDATGGISTPITAAVIKQTTDASKQASGHSGRSRCARCGLAGGACMSAHPRIAVWQDLTSLLPFTQEAQAAQEVKLVWRHCHCGHQNRAS